MCKMALILYVILSIKSPCFTNASSICYSGVNENSLELKETFICSLIWQFRQERGLFVRNRYLVQMLLLLAGDVELCPGPKILTCCTCMKGIRKNQSRDLCTDCEQISHLKCLKDYNNNGAEKLLCEMCSKVNDEVIYPDPEGNTQQCYSNLNIKLGKRGLKIFHQNINGLLAKVDKLRLFMKDTRKEIQVMGISESHCNPRILTDQLLIDGNSIERKDRGNGKGGGILCYIRNDLKWQRRYDLEVDNIECIWVEIFFVSSKSILICIAYKPPESSTYLDNNFATKFN